MSPNPYQVGFYVLVAAVIGTVITTFELFFFIPGISKLGTLYSYISGFGLLFIVVAVYGYFTVGWQGIAAFFVGKILASIINIGVESLRENWSSKRTSSESEVGNFLTMSEIHFLNAYRIHAKEIGKPIDITVSDKELEEKNWKPVLEDLAVK